MKVVWPRSCSSKASQLIMAVMVIMMLEQAVDTSLAASLLRNMGENENSENEKHTMDNNHYNHNRQSSRSLQVLGTTVSTSTSTFSCSLDAANDAQQHPFQQPSLQSLEGIQGVLAQPDASMPFVMDATDVHGAEPYTYKGFDIRPIYFEGLAYQGKCTLVFAWLSTPTPDTDNGVGVGSAPTGGRLAPGTVLLHGGGGTAASLWVEAWADKGFASIAMGLEGQTCAYEEGEKWDEGSSEQPSWRSTPFPGPHRNIAYGDWQEPLWDQWMFHAVSISLLANTLLRGQPLVNENHVGVAGVSWGGVIVTTLLPLDSRFAFAIVGYGTASLAENGTEAGIGKEIARTGHGNLTERREFYDNVWDARPHLNKVKTPTLWISSPTDAHFSLRAQAATYTSLAQHHHAHVWLSNIPGLAHAVSAIYERPENYAFARSVVDSLSYGAPGAHAVVLAKHIVRPEGLMHGVEHRVDGQLFFTAFFRLLKPPKKASLEWTETSLTAAETSTPDSASIAYENRRWQEETVNVHLIDGLSGSMQKNKQTVAWSSSARNNIMQKIRQEGCNEDNTVIIEGQPLVPCFWSFTVSLPRHTTSWYINVELEGGLIVSSQYNEMPVDGGVAANGGQDSSRRIHN
jgi:hypothetical protein